MSTHNSCQFKYFPVPQWMNNGVFNPGILDKFHSGSGVGQAVSQISFHLHRDRETPFPNDSQYYE